MKYVKNICEMVLGDTAKDATIGSSFLCCTPFLVLTNSSVTYLSAQLVSEKGQTQSGQNKIVFPEKKVSKIKKAPINYIHTSTVSFNHYL